MMAKPNDIRSVLLAAADLIEPRGKWCHRSTAREQLTMDATATCLATDPNAVQWSGMGAVYKIGRERGLANNQCWDIICIVAEHVGVARLSDWEWVEGRGQEQVVAALRETAELASAA